MQLDDSDPSTWSNERLERHARLWCGLPEFPGITKTMDDTDVQFRSDWLYMRDCLQAIQDLCIETGAKVRPLSDDALLSSGLLDLVVNRTKGEWPPDAAEVLLREWRNESQEKAA